ncbi:MAG: VOC family protein [Candidatus Brocadiaceae bacterium]
MIKGIKESILLANTILYCRQWQETVIFYRDVLGFPVTLENDWFVEFKVNAYARISVANEQRTTIKSSGGQGLTLAIQVDNADEIWNLLQTKGVKVNTIKDHPWGGRSFFFFDPEGNRLEVWSA